MHTKKDICVLGYIRELTNHQVDFQRTFHHPLLNLSHLKIQAETRSRTLSSPKFFPPYAAFRYAKRELQLTHPPGGPDDHATARDANL
jgi:hypothetical protein